MAARNPLLLIVVRTPQLILLTRLPPYSLLIVVSCCSVGAIAGQQQVDSIPCTLEPRTCVQKVDGMSKCGVLPLLCRSPWRLFSQQGNNPASFISCDEIQQPTQQLDYLKLLWYCSIWLLCYQVCISLLRIINRMEECRFLFFSV